MNWQICKTKVAGGAKLSGERETFVVGASDETTEDALKDLTIVTEYSSQLRHFLLEPN